MDGSRVVRSDRLTRNKTGILEQAKFLASESRSLFVSTSAGDDFAWKRKIMGDKIAPHLYLEVDFG